MLFSMPKKETVTKSKKNEVASKKKVAIKEKSSKEKIVEVKPKTKKSAIENQGLGKKLTCYNCGTKFYDLGKVDKICPKCGADQNVKPVVKQKVSKARISEFDVVDENVIPRGLGEEDMLLDPDSEIEDSGGEEIEGEDER